MFRVLSRSAREGDFQAIWMQKISMRAFASSIYKSMLVELRHKLPNFAGHAEDTTGCANSKPRGVVPFGM